MSIETLPLFHRIAGRPVIVLGEGDAAEAKRRLVERAGGIVAGEDDAEARLAFIASDDPEPAAARLRARGVLVNVVDRPDLCDFITPAILDRSPVLIAVGTGGASAGLAKALRLRLEVILPQSLGTLAERLGAVRQRLRAHWPDAGDRRRAIDAALGDGGMLDPLREDSAERVGAWLDAPADGMAGTTVEIHFARMTPKTSPCARRVCSVQRMVLRTSRGFLRRSSIARGRMRRGSRSRPAKPSRGNRA